MDRDLAMVLAYPEFHRLERIHGGHNGECPPSPYIDEYGLKVCWHWQIGVGLKLGRVDWFDGFTLDEAVRATADAIRGSP